MIARAALLALLVGCQGGANEGANLDGMWRVNRAAASVDGACGELVDGDLPAPYLLLHRPVGEDGGASYAYEGCPDARGVGCTSIRTGLREPIADGWRAVTTSAVGDAASCLLTFDDTTAVIDREVMTGIVIDHRAYREEGPVSGGPCDDAEALRRGAEMPCVAYDVIEATRL